MEILITVSGGSHTLAELHSVLRRHPASRHIPAHLQTRQAGGRMGAFDVINAVLEHGASYGSLAVALAAYFNARDRRDHHPQQTVTLSRGELSVCVSGGTAEDIERAIQTVVDPSR